MLFYSLNLLIFLVMFAIQIPISQNLENWNLDSRRDFKILFELMSDHFNKNKETLILTLFPYKYLNELLKELQHFQFNGITIGMEAKKKYNHLAFDFHKDKHIGPELVEDNVLIYYDFRDFDCEISARLQAKRLRDIDRQTTLDWFRTIFLFEYLPGYNSGYELWTRDPWKQRLRPQKIHNIQATYFNRKPNYHGEELAFVDSAFRSSNIKDSKTIAIKEYVLSYFNIQDIPFEEAKYYSWRTSRRR